MNFKNAVPKPEPKKQGRPKGAKNKAKAVVETASPYMGTYGRLNGVANIELLDGSKYRTFNSGNIGLVNVRIKITFTDGQSFIAGPSSPTFLVDRDEAWRQANNKTNNRSALNVTELDDWSDDEKSNWEILVANFGELKVKED